MGRDLFLKKTLDIYTISTHTPLVGRDPSVSLPGISISISTHTPLVGRDLDRDAKRWEDKISTHTPLVGRDGDNGVEYRIAYDFNSHAPCGA